MLEIKGSTIFSWLFYIQIAFIPILNLIDFQYCYVFYFAMFFLQLFFLSLYKINISNVIGLILIFLSLAFIVMLNHSDDIPSIVNLVALCLVWTINCITVAGICDDDDNLRYFIYSLPKSMGLLLFFYFVVSEIMIPFGFNDPIANLIAGERVKLISRGYEGHSLLIDVAFVGFIFSISMALTITNWAWHFYMVLYLMLLIITNTATSWLIILFSVGISVIELIKRRYIYIGYSMYVLLLLFGGIIANNFNSSMELIRTTMQKAEVSQYNDDFSAGRSTLNLILLEKIYDAPFAGVGHSDHFIQNGLKDSNELGAKTESGLRLAAKYGLLMFIFIVFNLLSPIRMYKSTIISNRIVSLSLVSGVLIMLSSNSLIEIPHELPFILYIPLCLILTRYNKLNEWGSDENRALK